MTSTAPLHRRLRAIDSDRAERQTRLIAAINHRRFGGLHVQSRLAVERDRRAATAWIRFATPESPLWVAPLLIDGEIARLSGAGRGPDAAAAAATLAPLEPLIQALERIFGRELHPEGIDLMPADDRAVVLRIDAAPVGGAVQHRIVVVAPDGLALDGEALPPEAVPTLAAMRFPLVVSIAGPALPVSRSGTLANGDLLLLGTGRLLAHTTLPDRTIRRVDIDVSRGSLTLQEETGEGAVIDVRHAPAPSVPVVIELDGGTLTAEEAAVLAAGSVLNLPAPGGALAVRVTAGGAMIGRGELVAVGEGYGVIFTDVPGDRGD